MMLDARGGSSALAAVALAAAIGVATGSPATAQDIGIRGSWHANEYILADGERHAVRGQIHFTETDWLVLFFVMSGAEAARGSAEGGRYTLDGEQLTFEHLHHLSVGRALQGLPESPLRMETQAGDGSLEPARIAIAEGRLTLFFPSGNRMTFRRGSPP